MDSKKYEVKPNENTVLSIFKFKVVETITYDNGHKSSCDYDFCQTIAEAVKRASELNSRS